MKIGIYTNRLPTPPTGGIPRFLLGLIENLMQSGITVDLLMPNIIDDNQDNTFNTQYFIEKTIEEISSKGTIQDVFVKYPPPQEKRFYEEHKIYNLRRYNNHDIIDLFNSFDIILIAGSALLVYNYSYMVDIIKKCSVKIIFILLYPLVEIKFYFGEEIYNFFMKKIKIYLNLSSYTIVASEYTRKEILPIHLAPESIIKIPHGINLENFHPNKKETDEKYNKFDILTISRIGCFAKHKNIDFLLNAWSEINHKIPRSRLIIIGDDQGLLSRDKKLYNSMNIYFTGSISDEDKIKLLHQSRAFILPSAIEAFGFAFAEALASGTPAIGLGATATPEIIKHKINGFLITPQNKSRIINDSFVEYKVPNSFDLKSIILNIISNDSIYKEIQANCIKTIIHLDWSIIVEKYIFLFKMANKANR